MGASAGQVISARLSGLTLFQKNTRSELRVFSARAQAACTVAIERPVLSGKPRYSLANLNVHQVPAAVSMVTPRMPASSVWTS